MYRMRRSPAALVGRLLRFLFVRFGAMSADTGVALRRRQTGIVSPELRSARRPVDRGIGGPSKAIHLKPPDAGRIGAITDTGRTDAITNA
jgi:hypothetical protein